MDLPSEESIEAELVEMQRAARTRRRNVAGIAALLVHLPVLVNPFTGLLTLPLSVVLVIVAVVAQTQLTRRDPFEQGGSWLEGIAFAIAGLFVSGGVFVALAILGDVLGAYHFHG